MYGGGGNLVDPQKNDQTWKCGENIICVGGSGDLLTLL